MSKAAWQKLKAELGEGGAQLPPLDRLSEKQVAALTQVLAESKKRQRAALNKGMEDALGHVPLLLRGAVRKVMLG